MVMWLKILPRGDRVWVKHGEIDFRRPGRETLYARFLITDEDLDAVTGALESRGRHEMSVRIPLETASGVTCALAGQTLDFRRR